MENIDTDVLIVGAGPTGLSAAILLARLGLDFHIVEKRPGPQRSPAAHVINARTFEIWRQAGVDMDGVLAMAKEPKDAGMVHWVTRLGGEVLGSLPFERQGEDVRMLTPTPLRNLAQHRLEPFLAAELERLTGKSVAFLHRWESSTEDADGVTSILVSDDGESVQVRSRYVIGADGAGSPVRRSLGIEPIGPDRIQAFLMIHFGADLRRTVAANPGVLFWTCDPDCSGVFVAHDIDREWVFMLTFDPEREPRSSFDDARCRDIVRRAIAAPDEIDIEIRTISPWMMTSQIAERYRSGRIFLAGDSAHRFPPTGGMGLNTGVQDAHNLVWKLAATEKGWAGANLLDTYESERRPVALYNAEQSFLNAMKLAEVPIAMGISDDPGASRRGFDAMLADPAQREAVQAAIANQAEHFDMLGLQLGFRYDGRAVIDDGREAPVVANRVREFVPFAGSGCRLPHGWVVADGMRVSTLDLLAVDSLTLLAGPASPWAADTAKAANDTGAPVRVLRWDRDVMDADDWWGSVAGMSDDGAILVRPDQHIAARLECAGTDAGGTLSRAVATVLGKAAAA